MPGRAKPRSRLPGYFKNVPGSGDAFAVYSDYERIAGMVKAIAGQGEAAEALGLALSVLKELGLDNVKSGSARIGFAGPDVISNSLVEMPAPRTGLFANLKTIDMSMFDMVDAGAMSATAVNCDLAGVYDMAIGAIKTVAGEDFADIEQAIAAVEAELKFKIRGGLLKSLSGETVFYALPSGFSTQSPTGGFVLIAKLRDAKSLEETLVALGKTAAEKSGGMVQVSSQVREGRTIHTWAVMPLAMAQIMPTWTVAGDKVVIASSPVICNLAVAQINSGTKSIRGTEGFKRATAELPANLISLRYSDSKLQFTQLMTALQQFWPMATMMATRAELKLPMILPNLSHIAQDMGSSCQYSWFDERGLRSRYRGTGIEPSLGGVAGAAVGLGVMMPALARARQQAKHAVSMSHMKQIGLVLMMYADENEGKLPERIEQARNYYNDSKILDSPLKPGGFDGPSYIYVKGNSLGVKSPAQQIVVYENPEYLQDKITVLFLDGHVERMTRDRFIESLEATYKQLGREMPEIRFRR
jgi:prepilin-type processing-associated H-X9-DG protein